MHEPPPILLAKLLLVSLKLNVGRYTDDRKLWMIQLCERWEHFYADLCLYPQRQTNTLWFLALLLKWNMTDISEMITLAVKGYFRTGPFKEKVWKHKCIVCIRTDVRSHCIIVHVLTRHPLMMLTHSPVQGRISVNPLQWEQYCILTKPRPHSLDNVAFSVAFTTSPAILSSRLNARPTPSARDRLLSRRRGWGPNGLTSCRVIRRQSSW